MVNSQELFKRRGDGGPDELFWEESDNIYSDVKNELLEHHKSYVEGEQLNSKTLSNLINQISQFQEDNLGFGNKSEATRIPSRAFYQPKTLAIILGTIYKFRSENNWRKVDFNTSGRMVKHLEILSAIWNAFFEMGSQTRKKILLSEELDEATREKMKAIIEKRGGEIVTKEDEASHIVYGAPPKSAISDEISSNCCPCCSLPMETKGWNNANKGNHINSCRGKKFDSGDLVRLITGDSGMILIHTCGKPPSWDTWVHEEYLVSDWQHENYREEGEPLHVHAGWVLDTEQFNEWMDEEDYCIPHIKNDGTPKNPCRKWLLKDVSLSNIPGEVAAAAAATPVAEDKSKRKRTPSPVNNKKKVKSKSKSKKESIDPTKDFPDPVPDVGTVEKVESPGGPGPVKGGSYTEIGKVMPVDDMSDEKVDVLVKERDGDISKNEVMRRVPLHNQVQDQSHHIIIPSYSAWFDYNAIHSIEKRSLPEFFNEKNKSKTPEVYMGYRNFMLDTYRLNPTEYLTVTAARRNLAGDVCAIIRVHAFLEQWGLINYQVDLEGRPSAMGPPSTSHFHVMADAPSGLQPVSVPKGPKKNILQPTSTATTVTTASQVVSDVDKKPVVIKSEADSATPSLSTPGLKMDQYAKKDPHKPWTDQETLLLLEALDMYRDDWNNVAEHVGTRTQDECIMHFLKLPIEDPFLEPQTGKILDNSSPPASIDAATGPLNYQPIPFSQTGNPVMSTVAFLASVVDPRVAASAAKAALQEFSKMKNEIPPELINSHVNQKEKEEVEKEKTEKGEADGIKKEDEPMETDENTDVNKQADTTSTPNVTSTTSDNHLPKSSGQVRPPTDGNIQTAAAVAFAAAAVKAKHLAAVEERKIKSLVALLVETQMKKLEIKLRHFEELEATMDAERQALELQRQQLINERQQFYKELIKVKHGGVINFPPPPTAEMIPGSATGAHPPATGPTPPQHGPVPTSGPPPHPGAPPTGPPTYPPQHPYQPNTQSGPGMPQHPPPHHGPPGPPGPPSSHPPPSHPPPSHPTSHPPQSHPPQSHPPPQGPPAPHMGHPSGPRPAPPPFYNQGQMHPSSMGPAAVRPGMPPYSGQEMMRPPYNMSGPPPPQEQQVPADPVKSEG
ncbi:SWI/SNF complex subunit SMARCC1-like isoform X4 [Bolinopsis microptera]|uniref:SWI/SNF complex subunit SMARCC1-like isoform X4 n=1 Tax=Bolinopsis microptera TaxID=2820187 RepID=UPI0030792258